MGGHGLGQRFKVVTALQGRDDAAFAVLPGGSHEKVGYPGKVFLLEVNVAKGVIGMGIKSSGDKDELGLEFFDGREPVALDRFSESGPSGACYEWSIDDVRSLQVVVAVGVVGVLKAGSDEDCRSVLEDVDGAVSVMNIEIKDGHPLHFFMGKGSSSAHCDIVVKAESHSSVVLGMVSRWSSAGENALSFPGKNKVDGFFEGSGGQPGGGE